MVLRVIPAAFAMALAGACAASAQTAADFGGPQEQPPASFAGQQYIDSKGCVYLRAGYGGRVTWVQRVSSDRKPMCGYPPSLAQPATARAAPEAKPAEPAPRGRKPVDTVASLTTPPRIRDLRKTPGVAASSYVAPRPVNVAPVAAVPVGVAAAPVPEAAAGIVPSQPGPGKIGCYRSAPVPVIVRLTDGRLTTVCTRGDGTLTGWRAPVSVRPAVVQQAPASRAAEAELRDPPLFAGEGYAAARAAVPAGYVPAWKDDRLNPYRAQGTAAGQAAQDAIWTRNVPARLIVDGRAGRKTPVPVGAATLSTRGQAAVVPQGASYLQIGVFGVPENARGALRRLAALGLPAGSTGIARGGKSLQSVFAGPFASAEAAQAALGTARGAGFPDAFLR